MIFLASNDITPTECVWKDWEKSVLRPPRPLRWFGLDGAKRPNREGLFQLGFALEFSAKEQSEMLVEGGVGTGFSGK